jgi:alkanesulfonate monooxygenase SsuD/methylene tetrahydromethanopterin reductase-like flavin-dependent oxidoreductase (luciferase family)
VLCAATDEEAQYLAASGRMTRRLLRRGELIAVPPPEKALEFLERDGARGDGSGGGRRAIIGSPEKVRARVEELAQEYGADEVIVVTITYDHEARRRSYELVAEAFGLEPRAPRTDDEARPPGTEARRNGPTDAGRRPAPIT